MELSLERKPITVNETILDINTEQAVESDMLLADYYLLHLLPEAVRKDSIRIYEALKN